MARNNLRYELFKVESRYQWYRRDGSWNYEPIKKTSRIADGTLNVAAGQPGRVSAPVQWGRYRLDVSSTESGGPTTSLSFDAGYYAEASADTPDVLEMALDKAEYRPGEAMTVALTARAAGKADDQRHRRQAADHGARRREGRRQPHSGSGRQRLGQRRVSCRDGAPSAR